MLESSVTCPPLSLQLPLRPLLSRDCRDLLQRLLERDPSRRISFQDFFTHPWVDLEHMPSGESLARAVSKQMGMGGVRADWRSCLPLLVVNRWLASWGSTWAQETCSFPFVVGMPPVLPVLQTALVVQAVKKDQEGDAVAALSLYCKALDFFVPALHCECLESLSAVGVAQP